MCYKEKGLLEDARRSFEKALGVEGISRGKMLDVKYELGLLYKQQGNREEALGLLREILALDQGFRNTKGEIDSLMRNPGAQEKEPRH